jgi:hypothetical protein
VSHNSGDKTGDLSDHRNRIAGLLRVGVGRFQSSEGFSQVIPDFEDFPALFCSYATESPTAHLLRKRRSKEMLAGWWGGRK